MQVNKANSIILLGLLPILFNLIPETKINLLPRENLSGYVQTFNNLEDKNNYIFSKLQNSTEGEVGEGRREKERASGRSKFKAINDV